MSSLTGQGGYGSMVGPTGQAGNKIPSGYKYGQISQFDPLQTEVYKRAEQQIAPDSYLAKLAAGDQSLFGEIEAPALKQFSGLQGNLASRFSGMGSFGGRRSSGFQNASNAAASDFAQQLQSNRQGLQRQAIQDLRGMTNEFLNYRPYEQFLVKKQQNKGNWGGAVTGALKGAGTGFAMGGPWGALAGAGLGGYGGYNSGDSSEFSDSDVSNVRSLYDSFQ